MATKNDDTNTASVSGTISLRSAVVIAVCSMLGSGALPSCTGAQRQAEILERLDRIERSHDRDYREVDRRISRLEGARGAGSD